MAKNRPNVIPIIEDARHPQKYRMLVPMVDAIFADVAQPDQVRCLLPCLISSSVVGFGTHQCLPPLHMLHVHNLTCFHAVSVLCPCVASRRSSCL